MLELKTLVLLDKKISSTVYLKSRDPGNIFITTSILIIIATKAYKEKCAQAYKCFKMALTNIAISLEIIMNWYVKPHVIFFFSAYFCKSKCTSA